MKKKIFIVFLLVVISFIGGPFARAATLSLTSNQSSVLIGQPFRVDLTLDTQGDDANALQGEIDFPAGQFSLQNIIDGNSPVSFWMQAPTETASGTVSFSGIIPDGFQGAASSVVSLWLLPNSAGTGTISLNNLLLLRNDGEGSPITLASSSPLTIMVAMTAVSSTVTRPVSLITPDSFTPVISKDPNLYGGQYFLAFSTTDKGSGIDYYEVMEVPTGSEGGAAASWHVATSPYLLEDQSLSNNIYVRAVDHDGNFIVVEVPASHPAATVANVFHKYTIVALVMLLLLICVIILFIWLWMRRRKKS